MGSDSTFDLIRKLIKIRLKKKIYQCDHIKCSVFTQSPYSQLINEMNFTIVGNGTSCNSEMKI